MSHGQRKQTNSEARLVQLWLNEEQRRIAAEKKAAGYEITIAYLRKRIQRLTGEKVNG